MQSDKCNNNHNCPPLRFHADDGSEYSDWSKDTLGNLGTFDKGKTLSKSDISDSGTPMVLYGELYTCYDEIAQNIVRKTQHSLDDIYITKGHEVVIPCSGETAEDISTATCIIPKGVALGSDLIIYNSNLVAGEIISYILNHQQKWNIAKLAQGKSIVHISADLLKKLEIVYPASSDEQQKIIALFSAYDEKIALQKDLVETLEERKKGLLQKVFSQEIRFKKDDGIEYPIWEECAVKSVAQLLNGYTFKSSSYAKNSAGKYNIITIANVTGEKYISISEKTNKIALLPNDIQEHQKLQENDILISLTGNVGRVSLNRGKDNLLNQRVGVLKCKNSKIVEKYLYYSLANSRFQKSMEDIGQGAAQKNISKENVEAFLIFLPNVQEQQRIADFFTAIDTQISLAKEKLETLQEIKKGLLQQMFC